MNADGARLLSEQIRRGINRSGLSEEAITAYIGVGPSYLRLALKGAFRVSHPIAVSLAELLVWPRIAEVSLEVNMLTCDLEECTRRFLLEGGRGNNHRRFCSQQCQMTAAKRRRVTSKTAQARTHVVHVLSNRLQNHQDAVAAHCQWCSPDGLCNDAACALRPVSPFPLTQQLPIFLVPLQGRAPKRQDGAL